ncbi:MAG: MFS transporter [Bacillota bacterium]
MFNIIVVSIVSFLTDISSEMAYPLIPIYLTTKLGAAPALLGIIEGIAESLASILKMFSGYISDKLRRRKPLTIGGYGISAFGKIFLVLASSWVWILLSRIFDRFGKGVRSAPRDALIAECSEEGCSGRSFGIHRAMDNLGAVIGIALSYYFIVHYKGDFKPVFLISVFPAILGVFVLFAIREKKNSKVKIAKDFKFQWKTLNPRLKAFLIVVFIFTLGNSSNQFLLLRALNMGWGTATTILLYLIFNLISTLVSYPAGRLSDKIGRRTFLVLGYLFYGLVYLGFALVTNKMWLWLLFGVYGLYTGLTESVEKALVTDIAPENQKATLIGLHAMLVGIGLLPASAIAGFLWSGIGPQATFYFGGIMGIIASIALFLVVSPKKQIEYKNG